MTRPLRPNDIRALYAQYMIWAVLAMKLIYLFITYREFIFISGMRDGSFSQRKLESLATVMMVTGVLYSATFLVAGIVFIQWFRRAYFNLHQRLHDLTYTEGWAAGAWFVPVMGLYAPYQIMRELYVRTEKLLTENYPGYIPWISLRFIRIWWILWVLSNILATTEMFIARNADSFDELLLSSKIGLIQLLIGIPLSFLALKVIRDYASTEPFLMEMPAIPPIPVDPNFQTGNNPDSKLI